MSAQSPPEMVQRFTPTEVVFHWAQAIPYLVLLVTGGILFSERVFDLEIVAKETLIDIHRIAGIALPACILLVVLGGDRRALFRNLRLGLGFSRADLQWLKLKPLQACGADVELPPMGKFNAGQKLNFAAQVIAIPVFFATGLSMWFVHGQLLSWFIHVAGFVVVVPLLLGHIYMALVNPSTRASFTSVIHGRVPGSWARHHHPLEYGCSLESGRPLASGRTRDAERALESGNSRDIKSTVSTAKEERTT